MNVHVTTVHDGKKQFKCDICNAKFRLKCMLNQHVATVHEEKKQFKCEINETVKLRQIWVHQQVNTK